MKKECPSVIFSRTPGTRRSVETPTVGRLTLGWCGCGWGLGVGVGMWVEKMITCISQGPFYIFTIMIYVDR